MVDLMTFIHLTKQHHITHFDYLDLLPGTLDYLPKKLTLD